MRRLFPKLWRSEIRLDFTSWLMLIQCTTFVAATPADVETSYRTHHADLLQPLHTITLRGEVTATRPHLQDSAVLGF